MGQQLFHNPGCRLLVFIFNGVYHFFVKIKHNRHDGRIRKKLSGQIGIAVFERIEQQRVDVVTGSQRDEMVKIKIQFTDRFNILIIVED